MDFFWLGMAFVVALLIRLDAKFTGPYFAFSDAVFAFSRVAGSSGGRNVWLALVRRAAYPFVGGLAIRLVSHDLTNAVVSGLLAMALLIWPAVFNGLPQALSTAQALMLYGGLLLLGGGLAATGWYVADGFGSLEAMLNYLSDHMAGIIFGVVVTAFGVGAVGVAKKDRGTSG
ncbi:hypothetical protein [Ornithinimicrobium cryptoxanthini]|uniref:Uncharacterized protein n=1 Tax=Ornithinimicrobium cryptoxanthini TaxID=2934161 RepID=A0ABY4YJ38_9MICO|nr:hypothetical protein [Ornithinimicrobium cryptoxanthini]USQ76810.1 hypothetical protein NF557_02445 [Ornithinimicrobium cryptoxanthini]